MWKPILLLCIITCVNCTSKRTGQTYRSNENLIEETKLHAEIAKDICNCSLEIIATYASLEELTNPEKKEQSAEIEKKITEESKKSEACIEQLMAEKFNGIIIDENLMESALKENCPDFYNMLKIGKM